MQMSEYYVVCIIVSSSIVDLEGEYMRKRIKMRMIGEIKRIAGKNNW